MHVERPIAWSDELLVIDEFDYAFAENGLTAWRLGKPLQSQSFIEFLGEERYKPLVNFCLRYIADLDIPIKRYGNLYTSKVLFNATCSGTFIEFRKGMINVSPIGRNATYVLNFCSDCQYWRHCSIQERNEYEKLDLVQWKLLYLNIHILIYDIRKTDTDVILSKRWRNSSRITLSLIPLGAKYRSTFSPMVGTRHTL